MDIAHISRGPGEKGNFVDRCIKRYAIGMVMDEVSQCRAVLCKTIHEGRRENIKVIRIAIMEDGPDDLYVVPFGCFEHGDKGGKIICAGSFNERPACPVTDCMNIEVSQQFVIAGQQAVVLGEL